MYGMGSHIYGTVKRFYEAIETCVRGDNEESEIFRVKIDLNHGCVIKYCDVPLAVYFVYGWSKERS